MWLRWRSQAQNKMDLSVDISLGSSLQIALFVAPVLVIVGQLIGKPLTLEFNTYELFALVGAAVIAVLVTIDGESHWLEGAQLLALYVMLAIAFFSCKRETGGTQILVKR